MLNPNEDIAENDPVRVVDAIVEHLDLRDFKKLYRGRGRCAYHPKMMLMIILYTYMNNIYSCRKIERQVRRDIHFIWLAAQERPDFVTINRFRNRVKNEINTSSRRWCFCWQNVASSRLRWSISTEQR